MPWSTLATKDPLIVVGIDPGTRVTGYGVVARVRGELLEVDHGVFRRRTATQSVQDRLYDLAQGIQALLSHHKPDVLALEEAFLKDNVQSALRLGEVRGAILLSARERTVPVVQYATASVKKAVCGFGRAAKSDVQRLVKEQLRLRTDIASHDAADALALALCLCFDPRLDPRLSVLR